MLSRRERRCLEDIETGLLADDPDLAEKLTGPESVRLYPRPRAVRFLTILSVSLALMCAYLGEGAGWITSSGLAVAVILLKDWQLRAE